MYFNVLIYLLYCTTTVSLIFFLLFDQLELIRINTRVVYHEYSQYILLSSLFDANLVWYYGCCNSNRLLSNPNVFIFYATSNN